MKILHLTTFLQGGAGRVIVDLAASQQRAGYDVTVVASKSGAPGYGNYDDYVAQLEGLRLPVHLVDSLFVRDHASNLNVVRALDQIYRADAEPTIIHAHAAIPSLIGLLFAGSRRKPLALVQTMHGWGLAKTAEQVATDIDVLNLVDRVAVPSEDSMRHLVSIGVSPARVSLVPYGISNRSPGLEARDRRLVNEMGEARRAGALVVACVGTIGWRKNQQLLVEAIAKMKGEATPIFAVFVGDGDSSELAATIETCAVSDRCRVHGYSRAGRRIGAAADVLVLPSRSEGQPIAVLEAFADGTLVAVSNIPELVELVADGVTGVRFSADNPDALADTLRRLSAMPESERRTMIGHARARHAAEFTDALMARNYFDMYREVLRRERPLAVPAA